MERPLRSRISTLLRTNVVNASAVHRGYSGAGRFVVALADGSSCFVKVGWTGPTRDMLRAEARFYQTFQSDFTPLLLAFEDDEDQPVLVLEDLSNADWPPPWAAEEIERTLATLKRVARSTPPKHLPSLEEHRAGLSGWEQVEQQPALFLDLGLVTPGWLEQALPALKEASSRAVLDGSALLHFDVRSDNLAFLSDRTVLVDWSSAVIGNPLLDVVAWLPSLYLEGGPAPENFVGAEAVELVALVAGYWASQAGQPTIEHAPQVRLVQRAHLEVALPWAARLLDLPQPDITFTTNDP